jgi:hypothetical protein
MEEKELSLQTSFQGSTKQKDHQSKAQAFPEGKLREMTVESMFSRASSVLLEEARFI